MPLKAEMIIHYD